MALHGGAERLACDLEPLAPALSGPDGGDGLLRGLSRPVPAERVEHVHRHHLRGAARLHEEGPEPVEGADIEAALALEGGGQGNLRRELTEVEPPRSEDARRELERVVPVALGDVAAQGLQLVGLPRGAHAGQRTRTRGPRATAPGTYARAHAAPL